MGNCFKGEADSASSQDKDKGQNNDAEELAEEDRDKHTDQRDLSKTKSGNKQVPKAAIKLPKDSLQIYRKNLGKSGNNRNKADDKGKQKNKSKIKIVDLRSKIRNKISKEKTEEKEEADVEDDVEQKETQGREFEMECFATVL